MEDISVNSYLVHTQGRDFLGIIECIPTLRLVPETVGSETIDEKPTLKWYEIKRYGLYAGELLAAFELLVILMHYSEVVTSSECYIVGFRIMTHLKVMLN